jgi:nitronate monooxygenase
MLTTRLTQKFGLQYPIMSSPMAGHSNGSFAAAVSNAGGMGLFGATLLSPERMQQELEVARSQTEKPFGVGFITMSLPNDEAQFRIALETQPAAIAFSFDDPAPWAARTRDAGITVICQVQSLQSAREAVAAGAEVLVAQGREAGGHTGSPSLIALLGEVLDAFPDHIVLAAGGIAGGRALAAVLAAGADGAWMGTRLLATPEAIVPDEHKRLIVESRAEDTVFTPVYDIVAGGRWPRNVEARLLRNRFAAEWTGRERELEDRLADVQASNAAARAIDPWQNQAVYMGTGVSAIHSIEPLADVIRSICEDAERRLTRP